MDDLNEKLSRLLSDPEGMAKIQSAIAALGGTADPSPTTPPAPTPPTAPTSATPDLSALSKLIPLLSGMGQDNDDTRLLQALRPYLHGERAGRLDETMQLLRLARLLPVLQEQGILSGMGGGNHGG